MYSQRFGVPFNPLLTVSFTTFVVCETEKLTTIAFQVCVATAKRTDIYLYLSIP